MILSNCLIFIYHQNLLINSLAQKVFFMLVQSNVKKPAHQEMNWGFLLFRVHTHIKRD